MANEYGNYATLNPLYPSSNVTLSNGNLTATFAGSGHYHNPATMLIPTTGKWALKATDINSAGRPSYQMIGVIEDNPASLTDAHDNATSVYWTDQGVVYRAGSSLGVQAATYTQNDVLEILYDRDAATLKLYKGGVLSYTVTSVPTTANVFSAVANEGGTPVWTLDFGQNGYVATDADYLNLSTANLPEPAIINPDDHFYSGTVVTSTSSNVTTTVPFNLDDYEWLMIVKNATATGTWVWVNSFIGTGKFIRSNAANAQGDLDWLSVSGTTFTISTAIATEDTFLVEIHKAGLKSASASNTVGSTNTTETSFNATSGFSMGVYEGDGSNATIGTGLSTAYEFLAVKNLDSAQGWRNWHVGLTDGTKYVRFDGTGGEATEAANWHDSSGATPAATLFSIGTTANTNQASHTHLYFGWHGVNFYSSFGKYEGNGATDGPMITTNFSAGSSFFKPIDATDAWSLYSPVLSAGNPDNRLAFNNDAVQATDRPLDTLSNGLKVRTSNGVINPSSTVIYGSWGGRPMTDGSTSQGRAR